MQTKKQIYLNETGDVLVVEESGIKLQRNGKDVGERTVIDRYDKKEMVNIMSVLKDELEKFENAKKVSLVKIEDLKKKFDLKEKNKIKEMKSLLSKIDAFGKYEQESAQLQNIEFAIERDKKDIEELENIVK